MTTIKSYTPEDFKAQYGEEYEMFYGDSPLCGKAVMVHQVVTDEPEDSFETSMFFTEYENGQFWSICYREEYLGDSKEDCAEWIYNNAKI